MAKKTTAAMRSAASRKSWQTRRENERSRKASEAARKAWRTRRNTEN